MTGLQEVERVLAADGNNLLHRAWHGFHRSGRGETALNTAGVPTEAVHGMIAILARRARQIRATHLIVAFDPAGGCPARRQLIEGYKSGRGESPEALIGQLELAYRLLKESGISVCRPEGWEADDVLATVAATAGERRKVWLLTADRDVIQTLRPGVTMLIPDGGEEIDAAAAERRHGVPAAAYQHLAAIRGEPGDGIPGIPGVGKVGAEKLIRAFGSVEAVLAADAEELRAAAGTRTAGAVLRGGNAARTALAAGRLRDDLDVPEPSELARLQTARIHHTLSRAGLQVAAERLSALAAQP